MKAQLIDISISGTKNIQIKKVDQFFLNTPFQFHKYCELVWIKESFGKRVVGDKVDNFEEGDLVLMGPDLPHIWLNDPIFHLKKKGLRAKAVVVYFPHDFILNLSDEPEVIQPTANLLKKARRGLFFYGNTHKEVIRLLSKVEETDGFKKILTFLQVIEVLSRSKDYNYLSSISYENLNDQRDTTRINTVYQFLMQNFHRDIKLQELAGLSNMTPNAFCRFFKSRTQKSFTRFLNELRIGHACKLLQDESYSVADVCYESGFNNPANFNKFFKSITKKTPSEYRRKSA